MTQHQYPGSTLRYLLFGAMFALILIGVILQSYSMLGILAIVGIVLAIIGDSRENRNSEPYKKYNELHHL